MTESFLNNSESSYNNLNYLKDLLGADKDAISDILAEIKSQWADDCRELKEAVHVKNVDEIKRLLHRIKSTFSPLGPGHILYKTVIDKEEALFANEAPVPVDEAYWHPWIGFMETGVHQLATDEDSNAATA
ncbi:hypothetical protein A8C56_20295 [Niabella ginsenosidivorans]|uniref:HPt domain-containing protein n=1 Tax=Niabella ginsenosidivorans TaxID=1176587 RepID=A0A1A9I621_9BACT|nr:hypothetical protein [Niabella ginsenosidivorans]ANH83013.1 hypothetical protein A8C56_20295 [Niabella ginsenosidivorans]